jgi:ribonuclease HII
MPRPRASRTIENALGRWGFARIAGVDEVGRGCLAGPVMAGAVVLDPDHHIAGLRDSKILSAAQRERLCQEIMRHALGWSVAEVEPAEIDRINIHRASLQAMRQAVLTLVPLPDLVLVDAFRIPDLPIAQRGVVHGDARCSAIAAASIVAKVLRDRLMADLHKTDPRFGYDRHKGYATPEHLRALAQYGYSAAHRRSFRPASLLDVLESSQGPAEVDSTDR